jgi:predicted Fe-S protein YdhL (DUF1289 family)
MSDNCSGCTRLRAENAWLRLKVEQQRVAIEAAKKACVASLVALQRFYDSNRQKVEQGGLPKAVFCEYRGRVQTSHWAMSFIAAIKSVLDSAH